ncbi:hypothetical protein LSAT2_004186 [Lamellibrachia satsuma]|nr:hypothetical protein LSAT2_004186 [Lamellibrachia satsuma]
MQPSALIGLDSKLLLWRQDTIVRHKHKLNFKLKKSAGAAANCLRNENNLIRHRYLSTGSTFTDRPGGNNAMPIPMVITFSMKKRLVIDYYPDFQLSSNGKGMGTLRCKTRQRYTSMIMRGVLVS